MSRPTMSPTRMLAIWMYWCGEVVEVDETGGRIFISISNPDQEPTTGTFYVRPFEFLGLLNEVYNYRLSPGSARSCSPPRATEGGIHPRLAGPSARVCPRSSRCGTTPGASSGDRPAPARPTASAAGRPPASATRRAHPGRLDHEQGHRRGRDQVGKACRALPNPHVRTGRVLRVGKGVNLRAIPRGGSLRPDPRDGGRPAPPGGRAEGEAGSREDPGGPGGPAGPRSKTCSQRIKDIARHTFMAAEVDVVVATAFRPSPCSGIPSSAR